MSRLKNRNIRGKLLEISSGKWKKSSNESTSTRKNIINEHTTEKLSELSLSDNIVDDNELLSSSDETIYPMEGIDDNTIIREDSLKSGESSISWTDEYEMKATQLVKDEYERMKRVLQCLELIPENYDKDEYKLWIKTFPFLNLTERRHPSSTSRLSVKERPTFGPEALECDRKIPSSSASMNHLNHKLNLDDLNQLIDNLYPSSNLQKSKTTFTSSKNLAINNTINPRALDFKLDTSFLQLAPLKVPLSSKKNPKFNSRFSAHSKTANWLNNATIPKSKSSYEESERRANSDFIVLPPIEGNKHSSELRSVSAAAITNAFYRPYNKINHPLPLYERNDEHDESESDIGIGQRRQRQINYRFRKRHHFDDVT